MIDDTLDAADDEVEHIIEYDIERPAAAIEEVYNIIPKPNPMPKSIGSMMVSSNGEYYLRVKNNTSHNSCPAVTQNLELNTKNRNSLTGHCGLRTLFGSTPQADKRATCSRPLKAKVIRPRLITTR